MLTLSTNLKSSLATTQFTNFDFNSMVNFNGLSLGAGEAGLFNLVGDSDNAAPIDAHFVLAQSDLGDSHPKRVRYIYLGFEATGKIKVTSTDDAGHEETKTIAPKIIGQQRARISVTRNLSGRYWTFKVSNIDGSDFAIDNINAITVPLSYGFSQRS